MQAHVPEHPSLDGLEAKWRRQWEIDGTFHFDRTAARADVFSIDTPPPTVSGTLHPGHACSYTQTDLIARYQRMRGREVFYPMGWDDNGLNVERRVQLLRGVICDPTLPYDPDFRPADPPKGAPTPVSRPNFIEQCAEVTRVLEQRYHDLWSDLGLSVDWRLTYETIGPKARATSQQAFLDLVERDLAYRAQATTLWDVDFRTAIAQAELADRDVPGAYHRLRFERPDGDPLWIETTRPELLPSCVAVVAHPEDERYRDLQGQFVTTPVFGVRVPVVTHALADPAKGSGIAMCCTFGDTTDVTWWRELGLAVRPIIERDGRVASLPPDGVDPVPYTELAGKTARRARKAVVALLRTAGALDGEPRSITHSVKFWENGNQPLEIVTSRQWFIRLPDKDQLLECGRRVSWHPELMRVRYENWVQGLVGDWNITRQRFFGVPFPVWYPVGADGAIGWDSPIFASTGVLPIDPSADVPEGYVESQRNQPGGFVADPDVMDTWATSSLTPQIVGGWRDDDDLFARVYPMDLRPQAHDIIRTWLFYTIVRSHYHLGALPWRHAVISGFVYDPDRKKLSKSANNSSDDPTELIARHGADAVRYWAAKGRLGTDLALDPNQFRVGRRLATKMLNVSRFVLSFPAPAEGARVRPDSALDRAMLAELATVIEDATAAFDEFDYARALERIEAFFWRFCDDYVELVKARAYGTVGEGGAGSAVLALREALRSLLRLLAPFLPFVTEEVWSWWQEGSVHHASWPSPTEFQVLDGTAAVFATASEALGRVRKAKSEAKLSMRARVERLVVSDVPDRIGALHDVAGDLRLAGNVHELLLLRDETFNVEVTLAAGE